MLRDYRDAIGGILGQKIGGGESRDTGAVIVCQYLSPQMSRYKVN